jgi:hypothetical protein
MLQILYARLRARLRQSIQEERSILITRYLIEHCTAPGADKKRKILILPQSTRREVPSVPGVVHEVAAFGHSARASSGKGSGAARVNPNRISDSFLA